MKNKVFFLFKNIFLDLKFENNLENEKQTFEKQTKSNLI